MRKPRHARPTLDIAALLERNRRLFGPTRMDATAGSGVALGNGSITATPGETQAPAAPAAPATAPAPATPPTAAAPAAPAATPAAEKVEDLPDWAQKLIADTRKEAGDHRVAKTAAEKRQQDILAAVAKAAGLKVDGEDETPDPAKLTEQLTSTQAQARQAAVELAVYKAAGKHQGDPDALLDSRGFLTKVADLDPTADDFTSKVDAAVKDAIKDNPKLKAGRAPGASGADHPGGPGEGAQRTPKPLTDAVAAHYGT